MRRAPRRPGPQERSPQIMPAMRPLSRDQHRREFRRGRALRVHQGFRKRLVRVLPAPEPHRVPPQFPRPRAAAVSLPAREAVSLRAVPRGAAAAAAVGVRQARRRDTRHRVAAEHIRASLLQSVLPYFTLSKNHPSVTHHSVPIPVDVAGSRIAHDFAALDSEFLHRCEHHDRRSQPAHGNFLFSADFE